MPTIDIREIIPQRLQKSGRTMKWLSLQLGQNETYIQQFLKRGAPHDLSLEQKIKVADLLDLDPSDLGVEWEVRKRGNSTGFGEEAVPYVLPDKSFIAPNPSQLSYQVTTDALENHRLRILPGDVLIFDTSVDAIDRLRSEQIVIAEKTNRLESSTRPHPIVRQYVAPGLLITNRRTNNEIISINDPDSPFDIVLKGVFRTMVRGDEE